MSDDKVASIRLPGDLAAALKKHAEDNGETVSDASAASQDFPGLAGRRDRGCLQACADGRVRR